MKKQRYQWRSQYDGLEKEVSDHCADDYNARDDHISLTIQDHALEADINYLMKQYGLTGKFPEATEIPIYGDFSEITDYQSAWRAIEKANSDFMALPAEVRARFDNNPQRLLEFAADPLNAPRFKEIFGDRVQSAAVPAAAPQTGSEKSPSTITSSSDGATPKI